MSINVNPNSRANREETIKNLKERLEVNKDRLPNIYEQQMDFARFHNGLVWQVSSILIPFSFAGLGLDFKGGAFRLDIVGWGSIFILIMWTCLAEWHRWLWVHSFYCVKVIEAIWGYRSDPELPRLLSLRPPDFVGMKLFPLDLGRLIRISFAIGGIGFWLLRLGRLEL
jgi:hypothetical protein